MATTIDSLQIEIQSSSTNAAKSIRELSASLGELKKNGTVTTAVKNLNNLSSALRGFTDASQATRSVGKLVGALAQLKSVGSVSGITTSLTKLKTGIAALNSMSVDQDKVTRVANALSGLSAVKAGGINTMMNGLLKIGEVTKKLDDKAIKEFGDRIDELVKKLEPLSAKMTTIKAGFNGINSAARSAGNGVKDMSSGINTSTLNFSTFANAVTIAVQAIQKAIEAFQKIIEQAIEWDGIAARFGRGFGAQAQETYDWIKRLNEEMGINIQQFMQYSSIYSNMLQGFGVTTDDANKMALGYTELTYDIWAGYNDIYKTFGEASEAVKSAIAGEVEPIRRAGFTIVETQLEQTAANHGLTISIEKATEAQKSYLRYLTLVDQAHAQDLVGTYAKELNTAEGMMRTFSQQLKSLAQAFGSLFLPILVLVMPYLQAFVELLTDAVVWLANLFGVEIQKVDFSSASGGLGGVEDSANGVTGALDGATQAAKELKNATLGIDELNVISPPSSSASSGGAGGTGGPGSNDWDVDSLWDESIFDGIKQKVDTLKDDIKDWLIDVAPIIAGIGAALAGWKLTQLLDDMDTANIGLGKLGKVVSVAGITVAVGKLVWDFTGAYLEGGKKEDLLKALGTTVLGTALAGFLAGKVGAGFTLAVSGVVTLTKLGIEVAEGNVAWNSPQSLITLVVGALETVLGGTVLYKAIKGTKIGTSIIGAIKSAIETAGKKGLYALDLLKPITGGISAAVAKAAAALGLSTGGFVALAAAVVGLIVLSLVDYDFSKIGYTIGNKIGSALKSVGGWVTTLGKNIKKGISNAIKWVKQNFNIDSVWDLVDFIFNPFTKIDTLFKLGEILYDWITGAFGNLKGNINEFMNNFFKGFFDGLGIDTTFLEELGKALGIEDYTDVLDWLNTIFTPAWSFKLISFIGKILPIDTIKTRLSELWTKAKDWWNSKPALKKISTTVVSIKDKIVSAWNSAKTWWNDKKKALKKYTPPMGSVYETLKERWKSAKTWWNEKKPALKKYIPSIGSIKDKVSSAWTSAKNWWNGKPALKKYTPSFGSIKDKLVSAWNSAKTWWKDNVKLSIPSLGFKVTYSKPGNAVSEALVKALGLQGWPKLSFAAAGGMFDMGSLIWAGERGAEVVANAGGGKTGVMNVQQMADAVYEGVYAAVIAANRASAGGGDQTVKVYLDGREITKSVEKRQRERGANIMGQQVYGY